jgi:hypothetical protein
MALAAAAWLLDGTIQEDNRPLARLANDNGMMRPMRLHALPHAGDGLAGLLAELTGHD